MAMVVMGLVLLTGYGGQLSLGQGSFMMIGAYSTGYLTVKAGWPPLAALASVSRSRSPSLLYWDA